MGIDQAVKEANGVREVPLANGFGTGKSLSLCMNEIINIAPPPS